MQCTVRTLVLRFRRIITFQIQLASFKGTEMKLLNQVGSEKRKTFKIPAYYDWETPKGQNQKNDREQVQNFLFKRRALHHRRTATRLRHSKFHYEMFEGYGMLRGKKEQLARLSYRQRVVISTATFVIAGGTTGMIRNTKLTLTTPVDKII